MAWLQVEVATTAEHAPSVEEALSAAGAISVTLEGADDSSILEPAPGETPLWGSTRVIALFEESPDRDTIVDALAGLGDEAATEPVFVPLPDREWTRAWLDDWSPLRFGAHLWVAPLDAGVDDADAIVVRLDPGLAFGTGTHPTTALCLDWLAARDLDGARVLDFGCGSGILAVAALRLGAARAHAVDIDPQALEATRANAAANGVDDRLTTADVDSLAGRSFDLVAANILAGPLIHAAASLASTQAAGGRIALAGILADQVEQVVAAYEPAYTLEVAAERDRWSLVTGTRRGA